MTAYDIARTHNYPEVSDLLAGYSKSKEQVTLNEVGVFYFPKHVHEHNINFFLMLLLSYIYNRIQESMFYVLKLTFKMFLISKFLLRIIFSEKNLEREKQGTTRQPVESGTLMQ